MNFKEYCGSLNEAKFREISPILVNKIKELAQEYYKNYRVMDDKDLPKLARQGKVYTMKEVPKNWITYFKDINIDQPKYFNPHIGTVKVKDLQTKRNKEIQFIVVYGDVTTDFASYSDSYNIVNLVNSSLRNLSLDRVESIILHELTHGFQQYKSPSEEYDVEVQKTASTFKRDVYYKDPIELDTHFTEIAYTLNQKYNSLKDGIKKAQQPMTKKLLNNRLQLFLQELKTLIKAPPESYFDFKELNIPTYMKDFESFLETIKDDKELWKKFKLKLINLYNKLVE